MRGNHLGWFLVAVAEHPQAGSQWVFKGGTCLKKCYLETYRFSEDLDFSLLPGEPHLHEILAETRAAGRPVDIVVGSAPGWRDPWSRARRVHVVDVEPWWSVVVSDGAETWQVDRLDIQAIQMAASPSDGGA